MAVRLATTVDEVQKAARTQQRLSKLIWFLGVAAALAGVVATLAFGLALRSFSSSQAALREQAIQIKAIAQEAHDQSRVNGRLVCLIEKQTLQQAENFRRFAAIFGERFPTVPGGPRDLHCKPLGGDDVIVGDGGDNVLRGTTSADFISAKGGDDTVYSRPGGDVVYGLAGRDVIYGGSGEDYLNGGDGNDHLHASSDDGKRDALDGGAGQDWCYPGPGDTARNCEHVG